MQKANDPDRFHRIVGWVFAMGCWTLIGMPVLAISAMSECLPRETAESVACDANKRLEFFLLLFGMPISSAAVGWLMFRFSRFLDASNVR